MSIIGEDIRMMRERYKEALLQQGVPCKYQFPNLATTNVQGESVIDSYSEEMDINIFFDGNPKAKTFKRYGWVVENDKNLPFLIHCSWDLPHLQKDSIFRIGGHFAELPERVFKVTEITYDLQCPDHLLCQVVPVYEKQIVGRTDEETKTTYNKSNRFLQKDVDYRGHVVDNSRRGDD